MLNQIHKQLGIKSPEALLSHRKQQQDGVAANNTKKANNLRIFATLLRAVARMRISAREWGRQEQTRLKLVGALEEHRKRKKTAAAATTTTSKVVETV
ncbi:hypothetical protein Micbo1qcDRAFT_165506 [Microdochium bolleyi]|uniref:Uncharacterized protein n=1 Tax=Microdochium bolleyi TaxID=196109 RepID=A0A136IX17_9PEZI|nr:hypothetical protein Micbo1qcDRAFT_165506 [Microdochium bolleyi]